MKAAVAACLIHNEMERGDVTDETVDVMPETSEFTLKALRRFFTSGFRSVGR